MGLLACYQDALLKIAEIVRFKPKFVASDDCVKFFAGKRMLMYVDFIDK